MLLGFVCYLARSQTHMLCASTTDTLCTPPPSFCSHLTSLYRTCTHALTQNDMSCGWRRCSLIEGVCVRWAGRCHRSWRALRSRSTSTSSSTSNASLSQVCFPPLSPISPLLFYPPGRNSFSRIAPQGLLHGQGVPARQVFCDWPAAVGVPGYPGTRVPGYAKR
eukprot:2116922-Rhodomonas_salina.1